MNKCFLMGRLTRDPEIRVTEAGKSVARYSIAVDRRFKDDKTDYFNCVAFGSTAGFVGKYLVKGTKVIVTGRIENDSYTNKEGQKVNTTQIMTEEIEFAESKKSDAAPETPNPAPEMYVPDDITLPFQ